MVCGLKEEKPAATDRRFYSQHERVRANVSWAD
jgi:hypothetical protein